MPGMEFLFPDAGIAGEEQVFGGNIRSSVLGTLILKSMLVIQVEILSRRFDLGV